MKNGLWEVILGFVLGVLGGIGIGLAVSGPILDTTTYHPCMAGEFYEVDTDSCMTEEAIHIRAGHTPAAQGHEHGTTVPNA